MVAATKYDQFSEDLGNGVHDLDSDTLKIMLSNTAPTDATDAVRGDASEISAGNGYTSGGNTVASSAYSETSGVGILTGDDVVFTASGGSIGPFQYAILYNDTPTSPVDPLIQYWDNGSGITLSDGQSLTVDFGASILTVT